MQAAKLGLLSVALVMGLSACNLINGPDNTDPTDPTPPPTNSGGTNTGGTPGNPSLPVDGGFGVSTSANGPFLFSGGDGGNIVDDSDPRVISVADGGTFYAQVSVAADEPVEAIEILIVNSGVPGITRGPLPSAGFSVVGSPTGDCDLGTSDEVTCTYAINVAAGTPEIEDLDGAGSEFAYVFRPRITVGGEVSEPTAYRGYVDID